MMPIGPNEAVRIHSKETLNDKEDPIIIMRNKPIFHENFALLATHFWFKRIFGPGGAHV